jgi:tyrosinase
MEIATINMTNIANFQVLVQSGGAAPNGPMDVHGGGRYTISFVPSPFLATLLTLRSGDPGGGFYVPPGDPAFYLHHGQIDRLWTIWQMKNSTRQYAIAGTNTMNN